MTQLQEQKKFYSDFGNKVHDTVTSIELAELRASPAVYKTLNLSLSIGQPTQWGLVIFCSRGFYFYVSAQENYMAAFIRRAEREDPPEEQILPLHLLADLVLTLPPKKHLSFLFPESGRQIAISCTSTEGMPCTFTLLMHHSAEELYKKMQQILSSL